MENTVTHEDKQMDRRTDITKLKGDFDDLQEYTKEKTRAEVTINNFQQIMLAYIYLRSHTNDNYFSVIKYKWQ